MFVNINDATSVFDNKMKMSMMNCTIKAYPTNNVGKLCVVFSGEDFRQLMSRTGVDQSLVEKLLERSDLADANESVRRLTNNEDFYPYIDDEDEFHDLFLELQAIAELRFEDEMPEDIKESYLVQIMKMNRKTTRGTTEFESILQILDAFPKQYEIALKNKQAKVKKQKESNEDIFEETDGYEFVDDGIIISKELGFKIQGEAYENLLENARAYVEKHGSYIVETEYAKEKEKAEMRDELFAYVKEQKYRQDFNADSLESLCEFYKFLFNFSKCFPLSYE